MHAQPEHAAATPRRWGGFVSFSGCAVLCVSFFLPQIRSCSSDVVPAKETARNFWWVCCFGLPFLAAVLAAPFLALRPLVRHRSAEMLTTAVVCAACLLAMTVGLGWVSLAAVQWGGPPDLLLWLLTGGLAAATVLGLLAVWRCRLARKAPAVLVLFGLASAGYFLTHSGGDARYGLWVSVGGSTAVALGGLIEFLQARSRPPPAPLPRGAEFSPFSPLRISAHRDIMSGQE